VVVTYDGATKRLYMDGIQHATTQAVSGTFSNWNSAHPLILGNETTFDRSWLGTLYLVALYDRALSLAEIQQNYNAGSGAQIIVPPLPAPWQTADLGTPTVTGGAAHTNGVYTVIGAGSISGTADSFRFVYQSLSGDGEIRARVFSAQNTGNSARAGVMIRESLNSNSKHAMMNIAPNGTFRFQRRTSTGGSTSSTTSSSGTFPNAWVRLVRSGNTITAYRSANGSTWTQVGSATITMASQIYMGVGVASGSSATLNTSVFDNVTVVP
jgi:regulation of enolase protein 1 (concanavalin A-like superfamily)